MVPWDLFIAYSYVLVILTGLMVIIGYIIIDTIQGEPVGEEHIELINFAAIEGVSGRWRFELQNQGNRIAERIQIVFHERTHQRKPLATHKLEPIRNIDPGDTFEVEYEIQEPDHNVLELRIDCPGPNDRRIEFRRYGFDRLELESTEETVFA